MAKEIVLKPIREWQEKEGKRVLNSIRLYIGNLHIATVRPSREIKDKYYCTPLIEIIDVPHGRLSLDEIKTHIELSLKEFANKILVRLN